MFDLFGTLTVDQTSTERHRLQEPAAKALGVPLDAFQRVLRSSFTERATGAWGGAASLCGRSLVSWAVTRPRMLSWQPSLCVNQRSDNWPGLETE